ncbi:MAG: Pregnancy-associated plasma protein-A [Segetibacter sp.]|jgi:hypothetical protein|nr:Pregnancy-associated plasma protein-A [Segetibacter sp.]
MRKLSTSLLGLLLLVLSCNKQDAKIAREEEQQLETPVIMERSCASHEVLEEQIAADPSLRRHMDEIEAYTKKVIKNPGAYRLVNGVIEIPVAVHVVYRTAAENISDAQVQSQITVLNEDFNNTNADGANTPLEFKDEQTKVGVRFVLDKIVRVPTKKTSFSSNDDVKRTAKGGSNPLDAKYYLNMWSCNLGRGLLGYAQFPGGNAATDGVVILYSAFGSQTKATGTYTSNYNLGRTATHEVGHWMNLRHIWGDATCGTDQVGDTPQHNTSNGGCPAQPHLSTCTGTPREMTMNYMDYTYDQCMYMFTNGQRDRMLAVFSNGGPRASFAQ